MPESHCQSQIQIRRSAAWLFTGQDDERCTIHRCLRARQYHAVPAALSSMGMSTKCLSKGHLLAPIGSWANDDARGTRPKPKTSFTSPQRGECLTPDLIRRRRACARGWGDRTYREIHPLSLCPQGSMVRPGSHGRSSLAGAMASRAASPPRSGQDP